MSEKLVPFLNCMWWTRPKGDSTGETEVIYPLNAPTVQTNKPTTTEQATAEVTEDSGTDINYDHTNTDSPASAAVTHTHKGQPLPLTWVE